MKRLYLAKIELLTEFKPGARGPAWINILGKSEARDATISQIVDSIKPRVAAIGVLNTSPTQHAALIAETSVRYIPSNLMDTEYNDLTAGQKSSVQEVEDFLGFPIISNTVKDIVRKIAGQFVATGVDGFNL